MKKMISRILALVMVVSLVFSLMGIPAMAETTETFDSEGNKTTTTTTTTKVPEIVVENGGKELTIVLEKN